MKLVIAFVIAVLLTGCASKYEGELVNAIRHLAIVCEPPSDGEFSLPHKVRD